MIRKPQKKPEAGSRAVITGGIREKMVLIRQMAGKKSKENGICLTKTVISVPDGISGEITGSILMKTEQWYVMQI